MNPIEDPLIKVLYQDEAIIAVEKPSGLLVHAYRKETNERDHLLRRVKNQTGCFLYPLHRLDRPVSGIVLFGLNPDVVRELQAVWHAPGTVKEYLALVKGTLDIPGCFDFPLLNEYKRKQDAETCYEPLECFGDVTLVKIQINTGRKHQIRRHFSRRCHNIVGDRKYGQGALNRSFRDELGLDRIFLHAHRFSTSLPSTGRKIEIHSPLPACLQHVVEKIGSRPSDPE
jgi:tRNA pseudouridine65 synthase